ncbi:MAG: hypothetical protein WDN46_07855 [Methylocella sp.]
MVDSSAKLILDDFPLRRRELREVAAPASVKRLTIEYRILLGRRGSANLIPTAASPFAQRPVNRSQDETKREEHPEKNGRVDEPEGGISAAAREIDVERTEVRRAEKVASLSDDAKEAAREAGLDDNQSAP